MNERLKNFGRFVETAAGLWLFIRVGFWLAAVSILLRLIPLPRLLRLLTPARANGRKWPREKLVNFCSFWLGREAAFFSRSCLKRSLVLYRYLNLQAEPARFLIGVRQEDQKLCGHAWILIQGKKIFPDEDLSYRIIYAYPKQEASPEKMSKEEAAKIMD